MIINVIQTTTIGDLLRKVLAGHERTCFVVDDSDYLVGVVSEGDLLRAIWIGIDMEAPAQDYLNHNPITILDSSESSESEALSIFQIHGVVAIPVVNKDRKLIKIINLREVVSKIDLRI